MNGETFIPSKSRRRRLNPVVLYDVTNPAELSAFHVIHLQLSDDVIRDLRDRAERNRRFGSVYVPHGLDPKELQSFHKF